MLHFILDLSIEMFETSESQKRRRCRIFSTFLTASTFLTGKVAQGGWGLCYFLFCYFL